MPRQSGFQLENNFTKGLITEATGLNFPENAATETFDCVFGEKGRVTRRLGFDYEGGFENDTINKTDRAIVEYVWNAAGGSGDTDIVVVQVGSTLHYYVIDTGASLSSGHIADTTNLLTFEVGVSTDVKGTPCQFTSGNGFLFVVHPLCEPFYVTYDPSGPTITETEIAIKCRDFEGDKTDTNYNNIETRPATLSVPHNYNLDNQGWAVTVRDDGGNNVDAITEWDSHRTDFPSMADIWWLFKNTSGDFDVAAEVNRHAAGNTPAPKGHFILNEFDTDRGTLSGLGGTVSERNSDGLRPSTITFFASRVWYAGVAAQEYNQKVYFSQIIDSTENFGKCYQQNDPTSSEVSDLLPTDGGVIVIPDVGQIIRLFPMSNSVLVFGTNGIWSIGGSEGVGFKATDYAINKISSIESLSPLNFLDVYGQPIWWNTDGIFTVGSAQLSGSESVSSLSDDVIKQFVLEIPSESKPYVKGAFNPRSKIVQWLYRSTAPTTIEERYTYDRVLNFNIQSKAFYPWTISQTSTSPEVHGIVASRGPTVQPQIISVTDSLGDIVVDSTGETVTITGFEEIGASFSFRYFSTDFVSGTNWDATWSQTIDTAFVDWATEDENVDYTSYFFSGYKVHGDAIRMFENNYITIFMTNEENASCFLQGVWDYANSAAGARFTNAQQVYTTKTFRDIQQTRKKMRGRGRSLHYKFYSEAGKPFTIHGWAVWETQNADV